MAYPSSLDNLPTNAVNGTGPSDTNPLAILSAEEWNAVNAAVNAVEGALGLVPQGSDATVRARLDRIDAALAALGAGSLADGSVTIAKLAFDPATQAELDAAVATLNTALAGKAAATHTHSAADVTAGTLPLPRGGTGGTDAATARASLGAAPVAADWATGAAYVVGQLVVQSGSLYRCNTAHTASASFSTDTAKWTAIGGGGGAKLVDYSTPVFSENVSVFGHSYAAGQGLTAGYAQKLASVLGCQIVNNFAVSGSTMNDIVKQVAVVTPLGIGMHLIDGSPYNDAYTGGVSARQQASYVNALRTCVDFLCGAITAPTGLYFHNVSGFTFTGTWATTAAVNMKAGSYRSSTTQNDSFTLIFQGDKVTLMMVGRDDTQNGTGGAAFSVAWNGSTILTGTLSNQTVRSNINLYTVSQYPVRLSGFGPGYHTITVTKTDASGSMIGVDCAVQPKPSAKPLLVIAKAPPVPEPGPRPGVNANLPTYNALLDAEVADAWNAGNPLLVLDPSSGWDSSVDINYDGIHPSSSGTQKFVEALITLLRGSTHRYGTGSGTWADYQTSLTPAPAVTLPVSDNFTRADTVDQLGVTSVGLLPWRNEGTVGRWRILGNRAAPAGTGYNTVTVETGRSDVTLTYTMTTAGAAAPVFRFVSGTSFLMWHVDGALYAATGGSIDAPAFGAAITPSSGSATTWTNGDVLTVVLSGNTITLRKNGTTTATYNSVTTYNTGTRHGMASNNSPVARVSAFSVA